MYSKGPLICRNISIQNRQMLLRVFNFIEQKFQNIKGEKKQKKEKSRRVRKERESTEKIANLHQSIFFMLSDLTRMRGNRAGRLACVTKRERKKHLHRKK